ncbi:MAG: hypothetical protein ACKV19_09605 [Verrucomicrobiales bacterium]
MALASGYYIGLWRAGFPPVTFSEWVDVASQSTILACGWGYGVHQVRSLRQRKLEAKRLEVGRDLQGA